jgi:urease accessory protein
MSVNISLSEITGPTPLVPDYVRADGGVRVDFAVTARSTAPARIAESAGYRVRFPKGFQNSEACEAVLINTGGGMAGGDRMVVDMRLAAGAAAVVTTQSAEKVYRAQRTATEITVNLDLAGASRLAWLPQETILFSQSRMRRCVDIALAPDASLIFVESVVFGRLAMGETMGRGGFGDRWRVRRDGVLVFAEDVRLDGEIDRLLDRKAVGEGARALATVLVVAPDAEARIDAVRAALADAASECGASAWNGMVVVRFLSRSAQALRADLVRFLERLRGTPMPRSWQT